MPDDGSTIEFAVKPRRWRLAPVTVGWLIAAAVSVWYATQGGIVEALLGLAMAVAFGAATVWGLRHLWRPRPYVVATEAGLWLCRHNPPHLLPWADIAWVRVSYDSDSWQLRRSMLKMLVIEAREGVALPAAGARALVERLGWLSRDYDTGPPGRGERIWVPLLAVDENASKLANELRDRAFEAAQRR